MRDGEFHLSHHRLQLVERHGVGLGCRHCRQGRVILGRKTQQPELRRAGFDQHRVVFLHRHADVFVGKRAHNVEEPLRFDRRPARRRDFRRARAQDRDVEISRRDLQTVVCGFEQDVRKNWNR